MEGAVVKEGFLYLQQQQTFGKKWRKFWGVLHEESTGASAYLELLEGSRPASAEKAKKAEKSRRHLIGLLDCVHVEKACGEVSGPKETTPFLLETTEKCYLLAAQTDDVADWILELCKHAFAKDDKVWQGMLGKDLLKGQPPPLDMAENPLYSSTRTGDKTEFPVVVRATPASERIRLWGRFFLVVRPDVLELRGMTGGAVLYTWPYRFLRRFGHDKVIFSFEAGRRCDSGEGSFEFATKQGSEIIRVIEEAIQVQRDSGMKEPPPAGSPDPSSRAATLSAGVTASQASFDAGVQGDQGPAREQENPSQTTLSKTLSSEPVWKMMPARACLAKPTSAKDPSLQLSGSLPKRGPQLELRAEGGSRKASGPLAKAAPESEYSRPFDALSGAFGNAEGGSYPLPRGEEAPSPTASCGRTHRSGPAGLDHVYDDPESLIPAIYDEPQEYNGEAWKLQATAEDPVGYEYPYNPSLDDYSVPRMVASPIAAPRADRKWPWRS
ncbi:docking protein 2 [Pogona vitticeps]